MLARVAVRSWQAYESSRCERIPLRQLVWHAYPKPPARTLPVAAPVRNASTTSSTRWKARQTRDTFAREAKVAGLKSRAAYKLLEIHDKHRLFKPGDTVVDLGYAPGSWSQVAVNRTQPGGRVVGIDVIPAQPPRGVSTLQGDFLSEEIQEEVRQFVRDPMMGRPRVGREFASRTEEELEEDGRGVVERVGAVGKETEEEEGAGGKGKVSQREADRRQGRVVNVVLSDMCEPWPQVASTWVKSVSNPYRRMMNTSGMQFRDHAGSMVRLSTIADDHVWMLMVVQDLCNAALTFSFDTLITGGHFLCKFYQGAEDHAFEVRLKKLFEKVHRIKPDSSRKESKEAYFVCLRRRAAAVKEEVFPDG